PTLAASVAGRLNSNPEEPEPPFTKRLTSLKSSDDGHCAIESYYQIQVRAWAFNSIHFAVDTVSSRSDNGATIWELRILSDAILAVNGGFLILISNRE